MQKGGRKRNEMSQFLMPKLQVWDKRRNKLAPVSRIDFTQDGEPYYVEYIETDENRQDWHIGLAPEFFELRQLAN
jgi:hypothetical protein